MRRRTAFIFVSLLIAAIFGLQIVKVVMEDAANRWMGQGIVIPLYGRILLGIAVFWGRFRWFLALPIIMSFLLIALFTKREAKTLSGRQLQ
jgi:hypothetical protein